MDYLQHYTSLVKGNALLPKSEIEDTIEIFRCAVENTPDNEDFYVKEYRKGISSINYSLADKIRDYVDDLKNLSTLKVRGISRSEKINVMLLGETSAGKTSFLERLYGSSCGKTGAVPITAFAVTHKTTQDKSYLVVRFKQEFSFDAESKKSSFIEFLKKYDFYSQFEIDGCSFRTTDDDFELKARDKFVECIYEANDYSEAFQEVVWFHKLSNKQSKFTQFADIIDMPGSGGLESHNENIDITLGHIVTDVDIVMYLVKSDQGIPSSYEYLKELHSQFANAAHKPDFFFVYQISNNDSFEEKSKYLKDFLLMKNKDSINGFEEDEINFFSDAHIVDARGPVGEKEKADLAVSEVLRNYFVTKADEFCKSLNAVNKPEEFDVLDIVENNQQCINGHLYNFLEEIISKCRGGELPKIEVVKKKFLDKFCLNKRRKEFDYIDLDNTLDNLYDKIIDSVDSLFDYLSTKSLSGMIRQTKFTFDPTKYGTSFYEEYKENKSWQKLIYLIQAYHWLSLSYNENKLKDVYARTAADSIRKTLIEYIGRLKSVDNLLPVIMCVKDKDHAYKKGICYTNIE